MANKANSSDEKLSNSWLYLKSLIRDSSFSQIQCLDISDNMGDYLNDNRDTINHSNIAINIDETLSMSSLDDSSMRDTILGQQ